MPMIILHNISTIYRTQHSSIQCTLMKWMHHYLQLIPPHHVIIISLMIYQSQILFRKAKQKSHNQWEFILKANRSTEMYLVTLTSNIMISIMVMHSLSKINILHYYNKNNKTPIGVYMTQSQPKVTKYLLKWT